MNAGSYEVVVHHPGGIRTWFHPNRETQLARLTAVMTTVPDARVIHDILRPRANSLRGSIDTRQIKIEASRDPVQDTAGDRVRAIRDHVSACPLTFSSPHPSPVAQWFLDLRGLVDLRKGR